MKTAEQTIVDVSAEEIANLERLLKVASPRPRVMSKMGYVVSGTLVEDKTWVLAGADIA